MDFAELLKAVTELSVEQNLLRDLLVRRELETIREQVVRRPTDAAPINAAITIWPGDERFPQRCELPPELVRVLDTSLDKGILLDKTVPAINGVLPQRAMRPLGFICAYETFADGGRKASENRKSVWRIARYAEQLCRLLSFPHDGGDLCSVMPWTAYVLLTAEAMRHVWRHPSVACYYEGPLQSSEHLTYWRLFDLDAHSIRMIDRLLHSEGNLAHPTPDQWTDASRNLSTTPVTEGTSTDDDLVTIAEVAVKVHLEAKSMTRYVKDWPEPRIPKQGTRAGKYLLRDLLPTLRQQFPKFYPPE